MPFGAQKEATLGENLKNIPLTNKWPECIDIWYEALLWDKEILVCANKLPGVTNDPSPSK